MLRQNKHPLLLWLLALVLIAACAPVLSSAPAVPTLDEHTINTIIAQTAAAAASQTAQAAPTLTPSPLPHPSTAAPLLLFNSPTVSPLLLLSTPKPAGSKKYACRIIKSPPDGTTYAPRTDFNAVWLLQNSGQLPWQSDAIVFAYQAGDRFHKTASYNLTKPVLEFGETVEFSVEMRAPKSPGRYTTIWALQTSSESFCNVSLTIVVKE
jgi:hypothetical protein